MVCEFTNATIEPLWSDISCRIEPGEFVAVLGPNGVGKSTLLRAILGTTALTRGRVITEGNIGFIPQQRMFPTELPLRGRDVVSLALAHGMLRNRRADKRRVDALLKRVGADFFADRRVGVLSGGQQQLIRQAQALANDPALLLCDEPLLSLDYAMQRRTVDMLDRQRTEHGTAIVFVTHSINPILKVTDKILYLGPTGHTFGPIEEVMTSETLSKLYGTQVDVLTIGDRVVVV
ncbi:metal ABC transporter ATP-binding protein [Corynebacterium aquilae]|uniref:ABC transporter ATP-binding protein n=1 Tax=Corynebacterium aquilae DSM 44791 TaxID=1431546 RepID=A0A1L7CHY7_9CORY|nr:metal ABC transporter ATP-binding protein [Corynebacterium aquilae]APT85470.1 ABC transporter ATP-binding protein [Corynebacterium aquilae DSM 44791]